MKSPFTGKDMSLQVRTENLTFRKESFLVKYPSYYCEDTGHYLTTTEFDTIKMKQVYNQYRDEFNLPFPEEIRAIRTKYGLSAVKMSELLGFGVNSYRNYENGEVPNQSNANLIQLAKDPVKFKSLIELSNVFEDDAESKENLLKKVEKLIIKEKRTKFSLNFKDYLLGNNYPDNYSGYLQPDIEKLTEMVVFFSKEMQPYVTQLNKLLFYADFLNYKKEAVSMSGTRYRAIDLGPVPNNYNSIYDYLNSIQAIQIEEKEFERGYSKKFIPVKEFDSSIFSESELQVLYEVVRIFKDKSTKEIINISHLEDAWKENFHNGKQLIDYSYAFNLKI